MKLPLLDIQVINEEYCGVPPSWMSPRSSASTSQQSVPEAPTQIELPFANDGTFMQQFQKSAEAQESLSIPFANDGTFMDRFRKVASEELCSERSSPRPDMIEQDDSPPNSSPQDSQEKALDSKPKKSLLAAFSTKKKEAKPPLVAASGGSETEEQARKRKRDEYLAEMERYRNTSCGDAGSKHSLVK